MAEPSLEDILCDSMGCDDNAHGNLCTFIVMGDEVKALIEREVERVRRETIEECLALATGIHCLCGHFDRCTHGEEAAAIRKRLTKLKESPCPK